MTPSDELLLDRRPEPRSRARDPRPGTLSGPTRTDPLNPVTLAAALPLPANTWRSSVDTHLLALGLAPLARGSFGRSSALPALDVRPGALAPIRPLDPGRRRSARVRGRCPDGGRPPGRRILRPGPFFPLHEMTCPLRFAWEAGGEGPEPPSPARRPRTVSLKSFRAAA